MINVILSFAVRKLYQSDVHLVKKRFNEKNITEKERERDIQFLKHGTREIFFFSFYIKIREYRAFRNLAESKSLLKISSWNL